jgi:hypothetical protein
MILTFIINPINVFDLQPVYENKIYFELEPIFYSSLFYDRKRINQSLN